MLNYLLYLILAVVVLVILFIKWKHSYWQRQGVYVEHPEFLFGNTREVFFQQISFVAVINKFYNTLVEKKQPYGGIYMFHKTFFVPADLDLIQCILVKDFQHFTDHPGYVNLNVEPITGHLFNLKGEEWRRMRAKLTPTFTSGKIKMMFHTALDCTKNLLKVIDEKLENDEPLPIKDLSARFTNDVIMSCAFGVEGNCLTTPNPEFLKIGRLFMKGSFRRSILRTIHFLFPRLTDILQLNPVDKEISDFFRDLVTSVVKYREENNIIRQDFMHLLIQLKNNVKISNDQVGDLKGNKGTSEEGGITINEMIAQAFVFWFAGHETSSSAASFCLYEISKQIQIQDRLREEVKSVLQKYNGEITYDALQEMSYMEQCIKETLRMYPPLPVHMRVCTKEYRIPNTNIVLPKDMVVPVPVFALQRHPALHPNPDQFDPDRFLPENSVKRHPMAWTAFGAGPRLCIGNRFGMMQTKMALTVLLNKYKFTLNSKMEKTLTFAKGSPLLASKEEILLDTEKI